MLKCLQSNGAKMYQFSTWKYHKVLKMYQIITKYVKLYQEMYQEIYHKQTYTYYLKLLIYAFFTSEDVDFSPLFSKFSLEYCCNQFLVIFLWRQQWKMPISIDQTSVCLGVFAPITRKESWILQRRYHNQTELPLLQNLPAYC